jgi:hypothetical protein
VGRALLVYPRVAEALCSGRLSYSKVRAITRVVTPETEATLIDLASAVPTSQIERIVAGRKRVDALGDTDNHRARHFDTYSDDDSSAVGMFRLDADEGAALHAALTLGKEILRGENVQLNVPGPRPRSTTARPSACGPWSPTPMP